MNKRKRYRITKNVKTLGDLLSKDDIHSFLTEFIARDLPRAKSLVLIFTDEDDTTYIGTCGMTNSKELHGVIVEALFIALTQDMDEDEANGGPGEQPKGDK